MSSFLNSFGIYLNLNDNQTNNICTWNYSYNISPFIVDLYNYLNAIPNKNIFLENINNKITNYNNSEYYINKDEFMSDLEHYMYISPRDNYKETYDNKKIFPDLDIIATNIITYNNQQLDKNVIK